MSKAELMTLVRGMAEGQDLKASRAQQPGASATDQAQKASGRSTMTRTADLLAQGGPGDRAPGLPAFTDDDTSDEEDEGSEEKVMWANKKAKVPVTNLFRILDRPWKDAKFRRWVWSASLPLNNACGPLNARRTILADSEHRIQLCLAMREKSIPPFLRSYLVELIALHLVTVDVLSPLTLGQYLAYGTAESLRQASVVTEEVLPTLVVDSPISMVLLGKHRRGDYMEESWARMLTESTKLSGEAIRSAPSFNLELKALFSSQAHPLSQIHAAPMSMLAAPAGTQVGTATISPADSASQVNASMPRTIGQQRYGPILSDIEKRCLKCGRLGHRADRCPKPDPRFKPNKVYWLLSQMSWGHIPPPS